ncbi:MAG: OB-fold nucleic acid binding domain-containing protein, partial [Dehalococcoidia bacterium]
MSLTVDQLQKVLKLEQAKGYRDQAVMGGLDRLLRNLTPSNPNLTRLLSLSYSALDERKREEWVRSVLEQLDTAEPEVEPLPQVMHRRREPASQRPQGDIDRYLDSAITSIKGISSSLASKFGKLGVITVRQFLYFFPLRHIDYSQRRLISELEEGMEQTIVAIVWEAAAKTTSYRKRMTEAIVGDESGNIRVIWFNQPYLAKKLTPNSRVVISGKVSEFRNRKVFQSPEWEPLDSDDLIHTGRLVPVYPLTAGLSPRVVRKLVKGNLDCWLP